MVHIKCIAVVEVETLMAYVLLHLLSTSLIFTFSINSVPMGAALSRQMHLSDHVDVLYVLGGATDIYLWFNWCAFLW